MKILWLFLLLAPALLAQEDVPATEAEKEARANARSVSLRDLEEADEKLNKERETLAKSERRIAMLLEDLDNKALALDAKEASLRDLLAQNAQADDGAPVGVPQVQVDYWDKRNPNIAAKDFALLYINEPKVAVDIIKRMKKKTSAALIDEVAKVAEDGINGTRIAAMLIEAVGTGKFDTL